MTSPDAGIPSFNSPQEKVFFFPRPEDKKKTSCDFCTCTLSCDYICTLHVTTVYIVCCVRPIPSIKCASLVLEVVLESRLLPVDGEDVSNAVGLEAVLVLRRLLR